MGAFVRWPIVLVLAAACGGSSGTIPVEDLKVPGAQVFDATAMGSGPCSSVSVADLIAKIHSKLGSLSDITQVELQTGGDPPAVVVPYRDEDGGFSLVFRRGSGDCPSGCIDNEYWYFQTDSKCEPQQVGHYAEDNSEDGTCFDVQGLPMWKTPKPMDPSYQCGADMTPQSISGSYTLGASGTQTACTDKAGAEPQVAVAMAVTMTIAQDPGDLSKGTVTFQGTGSAVVDGQPLPATFKRRRFDASASWSNLPATCPEDSGVSATYDFEGYAPGTLRAGESRTLDCSTGAYCKGELQLDLAQ